MNDRISFHLELKFHGKYLPDDETLKKLPDFYISSDFIDIRWKWSEKMKNHES